MRHTTLVALSHSKHIVANVCEHMIIFAVGVCYLSGNLVRPLAGNGLGIFNRVSKFNIKERMFEHILISQFVMFFSGEKRTANVVGYRYSIQFDC